MEKIKGVWLVLSMITWKSIWKCQCLVQLSGLFDIIVRDLDHGQEITLDLCWVINTL
jgi:hypothetical protein